MFKYAAVPGLHESVAKGPNALAWPTCNYRHQPDSSEVSQQGR